MAPSFGNPPSSRNRTPRALFALPAIALAFVAAMQFAPALRAAVAPGKTNTFLVEAEALDALGCWETAEDNGVSFIVTTHTDRSRADASTQRQDALAIGGFTLPAAGNYTIWACSRNYGAGSTNRRFKVWVDDIAPGIEGGAHTADGWRWEAVAANLPLAAGNHTLKIEDTTFYYARVDAILITSADLDPNAAGITRDSLNTYAIAPIQATRAAVASGGLDNPTVTEGASGVVAELRNQDIAVRFRRAQTGDGQAVLLREIEFLTNPPGTGATGVAGQTWRAKVEPVHLLRASEPIAQFGWTPKWKNTETENWILAGAPCTLAADRRNSFLAGDARAAYLPDSIAQTIDGRTVGVLYKIRQGVTLAGAPSEITVTWSLPETGHAARMQLSLAPSQAGYYSLAFAAGGAGGFDAGGVAAVQLPPLYQFKRVPSLPVMIMSNMTPHPLALVETHDALRLTHGVVADPGTLATEWAERDNATHGFALRGREGALQPAVFSPILGARGSQIAAGGTLSASWWVMTAPVAWANAMRAADTGVLTWRDYREPHTSSITSQAVAIINLIKSGANFRWYDNLKGPSNIEAPTTATQSAPLMLASAALLSRDTAFYKQRALPSLEFMLSRAYAHFALTTENNSYVKLENDTRLTFAKSRNYGAALWQGFDELFGGLNTWLRDYMTDTSGAVVSPGGIVPKWSDKLALYRAKAATEPAAAATLLAEIKTDAKTWAAAAFDNPDQTPRDISAFYHTTFYPYWWDLLDLHELTYDPELLAYAKRGAALTAAGMWVHPLVPADTNATMTLYAGGATTVARTQWWDGDTRSRIGFPADHPAGTPITFNIPQKTVPAWLPATAGLSLEQPSTYFTPHGLNNIQNTTWAANLLRLYGATGDDYWRAHARNALIGRGATYPGYYLTMYMDLQHSPAYTESGPDLTSFYWHHAPVHLAMLVDYLVTDADTRTNGAIRFPYVKSQGYVWFSSRVYGGRPGKVFDDTNCHLWLDDKKFNTDTPKIDFLGARGEDKFHLVLLNQARDALTGAKVYIDNAALRIAPGAPAQLRDSTGNITTLAPGADGKYTISLARRGWAVLTLDAAPETPAPAAAAPPLTEKPIVATIDATWGDMHAFRIRSPHGADSLYVGMTGAPPGGRMTLLLVDAAGASRAIATKTAAPYELTAPDIAFGDALKFKLQLESPSGGAITTPPATFAGTKPATPGGLAASDKGNATAALAWTPAPGATTYNIKRATTPAGPFQKIAQLTAPADTTAPVTHTDEKLTDNQDYYYRVSAANTYGETTDSPVAGVSILNPAAPRITTAPLTQNAELGKPLTLTVATTEAGATYQWFKDGAAIAGATSATLTLTGSPSAAGIYTVRVTGRNGSTITNPATIGITASQDGPLFTPAALVADAAGIIYVADEQQNAIYTLTPPGSTSVYITPIAGTPGAAGAHAQFNRPLGLAVRSGTLYVADFANARLRAIDSAYAVTTHPATGLAGPAALATDAAGNLFIADKTAHVIRKIAAATGAHTILAGKLNATGTLDATGTFAQFNAPAGLAYATGTPAGSPGFLYVADTANHTIRKIDLANSNRVTTLAGVATLHGSADGVADDALFNAPEGITVDTVDGTLYVADTGNSTIREITPAGRVTTLAGDPGADGIAGISGFTDATGTNARFNSPRALALGNGNQYLYIADTGNRAIRRIDLTDKVQTLAPIIRSATTPPAPAPPSDNNGGNSGGGGGGGAPSAYYLAALTALLLAAAPARRPRT